MKHHLCACARAKRARTTMSVVLTCFFVFVIAMAVITTPGAVSVNAANAGDPIRGKDLFEKRCGGCHSLDADKEGPRGLRTKARFMHDLKSLSLDSAIERHRGEASEVERCFDELSPTDREALRTFLKSL